MVLLEIKVCVLDVNGVLIDSNLANSQAMARAFTDDPILQKRITSLYLKLTGIDRGTKIRTIQKQVIKRPFKQNEYELHWQRFHNLSHQSMLKAPLFLQVHESFSPRTCKRLWQTQWR